MEKEANGQSRRLAVNGPAVGGQHAGQRGNDHS